MKKLLLILTLFTTTAMAQNHILDNGYVYCESGFVEKTIHFPGGECSGLYTADGEVLVRANDFSPNRFYVADGTITIAKNAFEGMWGHFYLPPSVKYLPADVVSARPDDGRRYEIHLYDPSNSEIETEVKQQTYTIDVDEIARYNLSGQRLPEPQKGVNIVKMNDGSARKELVR